MAGSSLVHTSEGGAHQMKGEGACKCSYIQDYHDMGFEGENFRILSVYCLLYIGELINHSMVCSSKVIASRGIHRSGSKTDHLVFSESII